MSLSTLEINENSSLLIRTLASPNVGEDIDKSILVSLFSTFSPSGGFGFESAENTTSLPKPCWFRRDRLGGVMDERAARHGVHPDMSGWSALHTAPPETDRDTWLRNDNIVRTSEEGASK